MTICQAKKIVSIVSLFLFFLFSREALAGDMRTSKVKIRCVFTLKNGKSLSAFAESQYILTGIKIYKSSSENFPEAGYGEINGTLMLFFSDKLRNKMAHLSGQRVETFPSEVAITDTSSSEDVFKRNGEIFLKFQSATYETSFFKVRLGRLILLFNKFSVSEDLSRDVTFWMYRSSIERKRTIDFLSKLDQRIKKERLGN